MAELNCSMPHAGCSEPVNVFRWWDNSQQCNHAAELKTCLKAALVLADVESIYGNTIATYLQQMLGNRNSGSAIHP